jgi:hypothetical protein
MNRIVFSPSIQEVSNPGPPGMYLHSRSAEPRIDIACNNVQARRPRLLGDLQGIIDLMPRHRIWIDAR